MIRDVAFWIFSAAAVVSAWRVFQADSMVRAAYWLLSSFIGVALILVLLNAEFLGLILILMMTGEMTIMAIFMVMFMMNPAGLNPMTMVHQNRTALLAGVVSFLGLAAVGVLAKFPHPAPSFHEPTADLGRELLGNSMLVFETAGVALLATMVGAIAIASKRGRYGDAQEGSEPPEAPEEMDDGAVRPDELVHERHEEAEHSEHEGMAHGGME
jgi:NADH:ubiquinone oxidoreductase subunit 6 (subunit J)